MTINWHEQPGKMLQKVAASHALARTQLLELFSFSQGLPLVYTLTRYRSRTRETSITDFFVIQENRPLFISQKMKMMHLNCGRGHFTIPPDEELSGLVLHKITPEDVVLELSMKLFGKEFIAVRNL